MSGEFLGGAQSRSPLALFWGKNVRSHPWIQTRVLTLSWQGEWISIQRGYCSLWTNGDAAKRMSYGHLGIRVKWSCTCLYSARYLISKVLYYIMWCYLIIQISPKKIPWKQGKISNCYLPQHSNSWPTSRLLARASKVCGITSPLKMIKPLQPSDNILNLFTFYVIH